MPKSAGLEELREILGDDRLLDHAALVLNTSMAADRSEIFCQVSVLPEEIQMTAKMSWEAAGPDAGIFQIPQKGDLVIVGFLDGSEQDVFIKRRLTSGVDTIPPQAADGDLVMRALAGKEAHLLSDTALRLGRALAVDPTEQVVLGNTFKAALSDFMLRVSNFMTDYSVHFHTGNLAAPTSGPSNAASVLADQVFVDAKKASPVDDELMLSDLLFTEK